MSRIQVRMKACPITRSVAIIQSMLVKFFWTDMWSFKNSDGAISAQSGWQKIWSITPMLPSKFKRVHNTIWKRRTMKLRSLIKYLRIGKASRGKFRLSNTTKMTQIFWNLLTNMEYLELLVIVSSSWTLLFITDQTENTSLWFLRFLA